MTRGRHGSTLRPHGLRRSPRAAPTRVDQLAAAVALAICLGSLLVMGEAWAKHLGQGSTATGLRAVVGMTSCAAMEAQGFQFPLRRGQPGYWARLDRDRDGLACEWGGGVGGHVARPVYAPRSWERWDPDDDDRTRRRRRR